MAAMRIGRRTAIAAVAVLAGLAYMSPLATGAMTAATGATAAKKPNSSIIGSGKKVHYSPVSLNIKWSGPVEQTCTVAKSRFTITNKTKVTQTVTMNGEVFAVIKAHKVDHVCAWGHGQGTGSFSLAANSKATLTVHAS